MGKLEQSKAEKKEHPLKQNSEGKMSPGKTEQPKTVCFTVLENINRMQELE